MSLLKKYLTQFGAIVAALVLIVGFIYPVTAFFMAVQIIRFGAIYLVLDISCRMVIKKHLIEIIKDGLKDKDKDNDDNSMD